jgi:hypothetical protein
METPSLAAKLRDANSINRDVVEACENSADAPAIATGHENTSDLETTDASLEKVEGHHSVDRVRTIKNGKVRRDSILYGKASNVGKLTTFTVAAASSFNLLNLYPLWPGYHYRS